MLRASASLNELMEQCEENRLPLFPPPDIRTKAGVLVGSGSEAFSDFGSRFFTENFDPLLSSTQVCLNRCLFVVI